MSHWHHKMLGDAVTAAIYTREIEQVFAAYFEKAGRPAGMAVFTKQIPGPLHCDVIAYFTPAAEKVAKALLADVCSAPGHNDLQLLVGNSPFAAEA